MKYYRIRDDTFIRDRWYLGKIINDTDNDIWKYSTATTLPIRKELLKMDIYQDGEPLNCSFASHQIMVVDEQVKNQFSQEDVQFIPVEVVKHGLTSSYFIMVIRFEIDCVDEKRSDYIKWEKDDSIRPDKAGQYQSLFKLIVDERRIDKDIFRIKNFDIAIIVSETMKQKLEAVNVKGIYFQEVTE